jgi:hypothetical protein
MLTFFSVEKQSSIKDVINRYKDVEVVDEDGMPGKLPGPLGTNNFHTRSCDIKIKLELYMTTIYNGAL